MSVDEVGCPPECQRGRLFTWALDEAAGTVLDVEGLAVPNHAHYIDCCIGYTDPTLTATCFDADGCYHTEDIGVVDEDGWLRITDRKKDIIIRGAENLSTAEVEEVLVRMPGVVEAVVVAGPDARLGERVCAFLRPDDGAAVPTLEDVRAAMADAGLARQKWPEEIHPGDDLPRTPSGKVQKAMLRARLRATAAS